MPLLLLVLPANLAFAQEVAQENYLVRCEVYRIDADARSQLFADGSEPSAKGVRAAGHLRFEATLPCKRQGNASMSTVRRYPFTTTTTNNVASSNSVSFMDVGDDLTCFISQEDGQLEIGLQVTLGEVMSVDSQAPLPVVLMYELETRVSLEPGREWISLQDSRKPAADDFIQVLIVRVTRQPR